MSYLAILDPRIFDDPACKRAEYKVLWALGHRARWREQEWRGWCWPSLAELEKDTGFSHPTVIKALKRLEAGGYIRVVRSRKPDGSAAANRYYVIYDDPRAHMAQPERLNEHSNGRQNGFTTSEPDEVVKEPIPGEVLKEDEGGSKAVHGEGVYNGSKAPHGEGVSYNTKETKVEHEVSVSGKAVALTRNGNGQPLPTVEERLRAILETLESGASDQEARDLIATATVDVVFAHWAHTMKRTRTLLDRDRERRITRRLVENKGDVSELLYAIDGASKDDWIMGRAPNSVKPYNDLETVLRDRAQVERFAGRCAGHRNGEPHPLVSKVQEWAHTRGMN